MSLEQEPRSDLEALAARMADWAGTFSLALGPDCVAAARRQVADDPLGAVCSAADLARPDSGVPEEFVRRHAEARGLPYGRHAASLVFQRYAHRVAGVAVAAWVAQDLVPQLRLDSVQVLVTGGSPTRLLLPQPEVLRDVDAEQVVQLIVDEHLAVVAESLHEVARVGMANLWGNMGAAIAGAARSLSKHFPAAQVRDKGEALLATRPGLARSGTFRYLDGPLGQRLFFDRRSCCHWYVVPDGQYCSWCSLLTHEERTAKFTAAMHKEAHPDNATI
ncbi:IucA/IucC family C-terminal-domain containing protein [Gephyromycinifex aptenodytis]|uniref:IucA/IucC family C-terminal-domain containing protein n=1 Tax=Gephyromycinifex aptenodytis TaxID=2716227 RepID=UPI0014468483|nr:IucA/IucC family C-terminal-domain containing protein [Gephyromycinifex aptenodytis]